MHFWKCREIFLQDDMKAAMKKKFLKYNRNGLFTCEAESALKFWQAYLNKSMW